MTPKYRDLLLNSLLTGARDADPLVRASAMSNLGEVCKTLHYSLGSCVHEVRGFRIYILFMGLHVNPTQCVEIKLQIKIKGWC